MIDLVSTAEVGRNSILPNDLATRHNKFRRINFGNASRTGPGSSRGEKQRHRVCRQRRSN